VRKPYQLIKCSMPGWEKYFDALDECVDELRKHICGTCLDGGEWEHDDPVDVTINGHTIECRDPRRLLGTSCGCEYMIEGDLGFWEHAA
jgi:hypothetical protein